MATDDRSAADVRRDIAAEREQLAGAVDELRADILRFYDQRQVISVHRDRATPTLRAR